MVLAYNGKKGMLYLDGEALVDQAVKGDLSQNKEPLHIGDALNQRHFNGLIDEVRIYNRGLTTSRSETETLRLNPTAYRFESQAK